MFCMDFADVHTCESYDVTELTLMTVAMYQRTVAMCQVKTRGDVAACVMYELWLPLDISGTMLLYGYIHTEFIRVL